jgi:hypothetical protein
MTIRFDTNPNGTAEQLELEFHDEYEQYTLDKLSIDDEYIEPAEPDGDGLTDAEADAMTLRDCGMGTDEDYGVFDNGF